jgi:trans-aconitate methyltransferase
MAAGLVDLLDPKPGERVLDVGCGTGELTKVIADRGASVVGIDASADMIAKARELHPGLEFAVADARAMRFPAPFDAVFSNAALHWIRPPEQAAAAMFAALKPGGRLVAEFGGQGNVARVLAAAESAGNAQGVDLAGLLHENYFPDEAAYAAVLRWAGFEVDRIELYDRFTPLEGPEGLRNWVRMFRPQALEKVDVDRFFADLENTARPELFRDGIWHADYRRIRVVARRPM